MGEMMADSKKQRMSMLDSLASAGAQPVAGSMLSTNRALRSARDAVDAHHVWELDPTDVEDTRLADRLNPDDVDDLRASIEQNGQAVPILVRRHPSDVGRYLLVYGRRRLEAIRSSEKVAKVRALIANLDDGAAVRAQASENTGRRDLTYIERALFAKELLDNGFGTQVQIAEVLNSTPSAVSMAINVAKAIGPELARLIGPAPGIGRPRWEAVAKSITDGSVKLAVLSEAAQTARARSRATPEPDTEGSASLNASVAAFEAVARQALKASTHPQNARRSSGSVALTVDGVRAGTVAKSKDAVRIELKGIDAAFADWLASRAQEFIEELHTRWKGEV
jgi:ParB family transcriptional regulator, chromosome partitioning protein